MRTLRLGYKHGFVHNNPHLFSWTPLNKWWKAVERDAENKRYLAAKYGYYNDR